MNSRDFCYWLQGYFEIMDAAEDDMLGNICEKRAKVIKNHLAMVFKHEIDPSHGDKKHQEELSKVHRGEDQKETIKKLIDAIPRDGLFPDVKINC